MKEYKINSDFFDVIHERRGTGAIKYKTDDRELIPMWVADMNFKAPPAVEEALIQTAQHGIFGYTGTSDGYAEAVCGWYAARMDWAVSKKEMVKTPGVIFGIGAAIRALTQPGDAVMICQPVYHLFVSIINSNDRKLAVSELKQRNGRYEMDFEDIERKIREENVKLFLLCSPHNPVARVWTEGELRELARICLKYGVYVISDEIHSDFVYPGHKHVPFSALSDEVRDISVICTAPSKTFNLAGLQASHLFISNPDVRKKVRKECSRTGYGDLNTMAIAATEAAYRFGESWLEELLKYLKGNADYLAERLESIEEISMAEPEGTYLMWLDCRGLGLGDAELEEFFKREAHVWMNGGYTFGVGGSGFMRMNIACPRTTLKKALDNIESAMRKKV